MLESIRQRTKRGRAAFEYYTGLNSGGRRIWKATSRTRGQRTRVGVKSGMEFGKNKPTLSLPSWDSPHCICAKVNGDGGKFKGDCTLGGEICFRRLGAAAIRARHDDSRSRETFPRCVCSLDGEAASARQTGAKRLSDSDQDGSQQACRRKAFETSTVRRRAGWGWASHNDARNTWMGGGVSSSKAETRAYSRRFAFGGAQRLGLGTAVCTGIYPRGIIDEMIRVELVQPIANGQLRLKGRGRPKSSRMHTSWSRPLSGCRM